MRRLARVTEVSLPEDQFGPPLEKMAVQRFQGGDVSGAVNAFRELRIDRRDPQETNNFAYCLIESREYREAGEVLDELLVEDWEAFQTHNRGDLSYLASDRNRAIEEIDSVLAHLEKNPGFGDDPVCNFLIVPLAKEVKLVEEDLPEARHSPLACIR